MNYLLGLATENLNIRYLAWKEKPDPGSWIGVLRRKASITEKRAREILFGSQPTPAERFALIEGFGIEGDELSTARLFGLSQEEIRKMNLQYLIKGLPQGGKKSMAEALNVTKESVSRWCAGKNTPSSKNTQKILNHMNLDSNIGLCEVPLFLSYSPIGQVAQRQWLQKRLDNIPPGELARLFPALEKLFNGHEGH